MTQSVNFARQASWRRDAVALALASVALASCSGARSLTAPAAPTSGSMATSPASAWWFAPARPTCL